MDANSSIEWTDATWNSVTGCSKVSQGCKHCYAERIFNRPYPGRDFTDVRTHPDRLEWPLKWRGSKQAKSEGRPSRIFVNSMSDLFHEKVPDEFIDKVFAVMAMAKQHTFQVLTKRPERMRAFLRNPYWGRSAALPNVWLGVSVEDQPTADKRIPILLQTPAAIRFVSYEPAIGPVDFEQYTGYRRMRDFKELDWVIAGGESGPHARPSHPDWFRSVRDQCQAAGIPFLFKQWG